MKMRAVFQIAALAIFPILAVGCASPSDLTVTSIDHNQTFRQGFTQAYARQDGNGDTDVVLVDQATEQTLAGQDARAPVREVMHIHVVWSPTRDMKAVSSNAAVKWYVIGHGPLDVLEYAGIAFVSVTPGDDGMTLQVKNATLKPSPRHGSLTDPVGISRVEGTIVAKSDSKRVEQILNDLKTAAAGATAQLPVYSSIETAR